MSVQIMPLGWKEAPPTGEGGGGGHLFYIEQKAIGSD